MATAAPNQNLPIFYRAIEPLNVDAAWQDGGPPGPRHERSREDPRDSADRRRVRAGPASLPDRLLDRREADPDRADGPQRERQRVPGGRRAADRSVALHSGLYPALSVPSGPPPPGQRRAVACASTRPPMPSAISRTGRKLFDGDQPSKATLAILEFCEQFEAAGQRTSAFIEELTKSDLLMDGEVAIQPEGFEQPFIYRGFRMVDEESCANFAATSEEDESERDAAADLRPFVLAVADAGRVRAADEARQGAGSGAQPATADA